jgi:CDP-diacylglycerol--glycerol-3-phosphate 3-phosphatidyltransferase
MGASLVTFLAVLALALLSMAVYALRGRKPDADAQGKGAQFALGAGNFLVHWFMWLLRPLERLALAAGWGPDVFNFAGLACGAARGVLIGSGLVEAGGWAIALGGVCDIRDGRVARATGADSAYGKFIDSTLDRFVEVFALLGFVVFLRGTLAGPAAAASALAGTLLVSYTRARGESLGVLCKEGLMQRAERMVLVCLSCWLDRTLSRWWGAPTGTLSTWVLGLIAAGTFVTAAHRTVWISRRLRSGS